MKEYPEPNYSLRVRPLQNEYEPEVARFLEAGWMLVVNHIVHISFIPYLSYDLSTPPPSNLDFAQNRDEAARVVQSTSTEIVTPTDGPERVEELVGDIPDRQTIFWVTQTRYDALSAELTELFDRPYNPDDQLRLSDLGDSPLRRFLSNDLPRSAALSKYAREILCLTPLAPADGTMHR